MSASGEESTMSDNSEAQEDPISFDEAMKALDEKMAERGDDATAVEPVAIWAMVKYEEGTSGALKTVEGVLIDDSAGITVLDPDTGAACIIGDRFIVRVDLTQMDEDDEDDEGDEDQVDTSADRFRA